MQGFNFGIRSSANPSVDETRSRYVPSSIYSGPGPAEESPLPPHPQQYYQNGQRRPSQASNYPPYDHRYDTRPAPYRNSSALGLNDPVAMHLLMETAIMDSKDFEILSFDELEHLKRERAILRNKVEGAKRQYALEWKMNDAAQLMTRLAPADAEPDQRKKRSSFLGRRISTAVQVDDSMNTSPGKVDQLAQEVKALDSRLQEVEKRILQHTAGILQFTHRGLKKNLRKNELPRSPESMASQNRSISGMDAGSDFDERSLYQVPDYVRDLHQNAASRSSRRTTREIQPIEDIAVRLHILNTQLHTLIQQVVLTEYFEPPPEPTDEGLQGRVGAQIQAHLTYMAQGLEALETVQGRDVLTPSTPADSTEQLQNLTSKLHGMLERTNSVSKSPMVDKDEAEGSDMNSQLAYSAVVLERLTHRVDALLDQKDILTRQIQQQRELNSKSDAQRDAHIRDLTEELEDAQKLQAMSDKEMQQSHDQIELLMEQLDHAKQNEQLLEQQRGMDDSKALDAERAARKDIETRLMKELETRQHAFTELQADHSKAEHDFELKSQHHIQQLNEASTAKEQVELYLNQRNEELEMLHAEVSDLEAQVMQLQTVAVAQEQLESDLRRKNDGMKDLETRVAQLQKATADQERLEDEAKRKDAQMKELETRMVHLQTVTSSRDQLDDEVKRKNEQLKALEAQVQQFQAATADREQLDNETRRQSSDQIKELESQLSQLQMVAANREQLQFEIKQRGEQVKGLESELAQLQKANAARDQLQETAKQKDGDLEVMHSEMRGMELQMVQLQTELTMAKAELDASYGSRAQRAADASMNPGIKKQIDELNAKNMELEQQLDVLSQAHETKGVGSAELQNKVNALQKELKETIEDYEVMTKASIEFEKEREQLEATIDQMRNRCQGLEAQINEDQVKWLGVKNTLPPETTSTMVLKNEFKKMMRDSRAESMKVIKAEQEERRRLEGMIRALRKESVQNTPSKPLPKLAAGSTAPATPLID